MNRLITSILFSGLLAAVLQEPAKANTIDIAPNTTYTITGGQIGLQLKDPTTHEALYTFAEDVLTGASSIDAGSTVTTGALNNGKFDLTLNAKTSWGIYTGDHIQYFNNDPQSPDRPGSAHGTINATFQGVTYDASHNLAYELGDKGSGKVDITGNLSGDPFNDSAHVSPMSMVFAPGSFPGTPFDGLLSLIGNQAFSLAMGSPLGTSGLNLYAWLGSGNETVRIGCRDFILGVDAYLKLSPQSNAVPEPASMALLVFGLAGLAARKKTSA